MMEFKPLFYVYQVLCMLVFFEVLFRFRKNSLLKVCFLLMISSLYLMNYLSSLPEITRLQFILVRSMRIIYIASTMLAIIRLVTPKIPHWIVAFSCLSVLFLISFRILFFSQINIESQGFVSNPVFSFGEELYNPNLAIRNAVLCLAAVTGGLTFSYYRQFCLKMNKEDTHYGQLSRWIILMVVPFFLLIIFSVLGLLELFDESVSPLLFSIFSFVIILSILFRPKFLNTQQVC